MTSCQHWGLIIPPRGYEIPGGQIKWQITCLINMMYKQHYYTITRWANRQRDHHMMQWLKPTTINHYLLTALLNTNEIIFPWPEMESTRFLNTNCSKLEDVICIDQLWGLRVPQWANGMKRSDTCDTKIQT